MHLFSCSFTFLNSTSLILFPFPSSSLFWAKSRHHFIIPAVIFAGISRMDDISNSRSSAVPRKISKIPAVTNRTRTTTEMQFQQLYKGPGKFELLGHPNAGKDDPLILVNGSAFLPPRARLQTQASGSNPSGFSPHKFSKQAHASSYPPSTTYRKTTFRPHPYDNTTMLPDPVPGPTKKISQNFNLPPTYLRSLHQVDVESAASSQRGLHAPPPSSMGISVFSGNSGSILNSLSRKTEILYHSPHPLFNQSRMGMQTASITASIGNSYSMTRLERKHKKPSLTPSGETSDSLSKRRELQEMRNWEYTNVGKLVSVDLDKHSHSLVGAGTRFTLLSYNILAQKHLENHLYLYSDCDAEALQWNERFQLILNDINDYAPDIICLQEIEETEFHHSFLPALEMPGYRGVYKRRTRDKPDGCAIFWKKALFNFVSQLGVDLYQPHVPLLDRDNIALMVKLESKSPTQRLVVSTTHLLFNPKRVDVKLAQIQLILAEMDRFSFSGFGKTGENLYLPMILCGDFNTTPYSPVTSLITEGSLRYLDEHNVLLKTLKRSGETAEILPPYFGVSDQCQHYRVQLERVRQWQSHRRTRFHIDRKTQMKLINLYADPNAAPTTFASSYDDDDTLSVASGSIPELSEEVDPEFDAHMKEMTKLNIPCSFGSGTLSHGLMLRNIYAPKLDPSEDTERTLASTRQKGWTCVDFIFQGMNWSMKENRRVEGNLMLVRRLRLLSRRECKELGSIPNKASPSDHYPLVAEFLLK